MLPARKRVSSMRVQSTRWIGGLMVVFLAAGWLPGVSGTTALANPAPVNEYEVKAAFLYHFIQFVEWPAEVVPEEGGTFTIGVLGDDPFGQLLDKAVREETVRGRSVVVRRFRDVSAASSCHVLFVSKSEKGELPVILKRTEGMPVLTVGEVDGFAERGGIVNFFIEKNRIRFEINQDSAERKGLKISSKLLSLGRLVDEKSLKEAR